jgi:hypothetical protein
MPSWLSAAMSRAAAGGKVHGVDESRERPGELDNDADLGIGSPSENW